MRQSVVGFAGLTAALLCGGAPISGAVQVSLPSRSTAPGSRVVVPVTFSSQGAFASGIQFDLSYDSTAVSVSATVGRAAISSGKSVYLADVAPGRKRFVVVGINRDPIPDGVLADLSVKLNPHAPGHDLALQDRPRRGPYPLVVSNVVGTDATGQPIGMVGGMGVVIFQGVAGSRPRPPMAGMLNGASLVPAPVAPGEILALSQSLVGQAHCSMKLPAPFFTRPEIRSA